MESEKNQFEKVAKNLNEIIDNNEVSYKVATDSKFLVKSEGRLNVETFTKSSTSVTENGNVEVETAKDSVFFVGEGGHVEIKKVAKNCTIKVRKGGTYNISGISKDVEIINLFQEVDKSENVDKPSDQINQEALPDLSAEDKEALDTYNEAIEAWGSDVELQTLEVERTKNDFFDNVSAGKIQNMIDNGRFSDQIISFIDDVDQDLKIDLETLESLENSDSTSQNVIDKFKQRIQTREKLAEGLRSYYENLQITIEQENVLKDLVYAMSRQAEQYEIYEADLKLKFPEVFEEIQVMNDTVKSIIEKPVTQRTLHEISVLELEVSKHFLNRFTEYKKDLLDKYKK